MTYKLLLTNIGKQKIAAAASAGAPPLQITQFAVGQGVDVDFSKRLDEQVLVSKRYQAEVESVAKVTAELSQYEIVCIVPQDVGGFTIRELGLIDADGDLIWVGQLPEVQKPVANSTAAIDYRIKAVVSIDNPDVNLVIDANVVTATQSWVNDNFIPRSALELMYPLGYKYWSHDDVNPKPLFDALFGYETFWRRLEGVVLLAVQDDDSYINQPMQYLGQKGMTELANNQRPHHYPLYTSYLFERYDPSKVINTVWTIKANKNSVDEGSALTFTIAANNIPDGQILTWSIKEGVLSSDGTAITDIDASDSGTVIMRNGSATIPYTTTPDDNAVEVQKHVRLTVGAPANLNINIPVNDNGYTETVVRINKSTYEGIVLDEYLKQATGSYATADTTARFIIEDGVDIVAPDTSTAAITDGKNWIDGSEIIIENHGRILGRGGDGGRSAHVVGLYADGSSDIDASNVIAAQNGKDGGVAISVTKKAIVDNYNLIAGGGGGGGGMGLWTSKLGAGTGGGGGTGGGAPLGKRSPNEDTYLSYINDSTAERPPFVLPDDNRIYAAIELGNRENKAVLHGVGFSNDAYDYEIATQKSRSINVPISIDGANNLLDFEGEYQIHRYNSEGYSVALFMSSNATIDNPGKGGYGGSVGQECSWLRQSVNANVAANKGGNGGVFGEDGQDGMMSVFYGGTTKINKTDVNYYENAKGGLAGYIYQGNVTINNLDGGVTKGRMPE